jgi:hypothetical protein
MRRTYIIIGLLGIIIAACSEQRTEYFANGAEAQQSTTAKHGWIPKWFPTQAREIQMQYDIDTNYRWFRFKLDKEARKQLIETFQPVSWGEAENLKVRSPRSAKWWFDGLIQVQPANDAALNAVIYLRNDIENKEKAYLAVSRTNDAIFLWIER